MEDLKRSAARTTLAEGFALAVQPVSASTITTDASGLVAGTVVIGEVPCYRAMPEGESKCPLVLVVQEIFGVHEHIRDLCRRLAKAGYMAIAPELFVRQADVSQMKDVREILDVVAKASDDQILRDFDAAVDWAAKSGRLDGDRVAIVGFCWGGRVAWLYAAHSPILKAAVAWYGRLLYPTNALQPTTPMDVASNLKAPTLGLYAEHDPSIPVEHVDQMRALLSKPAEPNTSTAAKASKIVVYPGAGHAFNADYRPSYKKDAAEDGWRRMLEWFKKNGV
ncbi:MAG: dienelactone hydrolase family protein [Polyangiaceae bacterium]|nr:dienelactone hydrolase family protein [Polyangiaceae bacterium]